MWGCREQFSGLRNRQLNLFCKNVTTKSRWPSWSKAPVSGHRFESWWLPNHDMMLRMIQQVATVLSPMYETVTGLKPIVESTLCLFSVWLLTWGMVGLRGC